MSVFPVQQSWRKARVVLLAVLGVIALLLVAARLFVATDYFRGLVVHYFEIRTHRRIQVQGPLDVHVFSRTPALRAERVTISNPPWMPRGNTAQIERLSVVIDFPWPLRPRSIRKVEMIGASLHLVRDATSATNWQGSAPGTPRGKPGHLIRSLVMPNAHVEIDDARRHIQFVGSISAQDATGTSGQALLRIEGRGQLNGRPATFAINGDPLATVTRERPYRFTFAERSTGVQLAGRASIPRPFDVSALDVAFQAGGASMNDMYYLIGLHMPNTAPFTLSGQLARRGPRSTFSKLQARFGASDLGGTIVTEGGSGRPMLTADVHASVLRLADLGRHAANQTPQRAQPGKAFLLPDVHLPLNVLARRDAAIRFTADSLVMRAMSFSAFEATATLERGVLTIPSFSTAVRDALLTGNVKIDASSDTPTTDADLKLAGLQLGQFFRKGTRKAPFEGSLRARLKITGRGNSVHQVASSANGSLTAVVPRGSMRASLSELTGLNLRGLGLMFSRQDEETPLRCGVVSFQAHEGVLHADHLIVDTESMLLLGSGGLDLKSETLDLTLRGHPKKLRLVRMRAPVYVTGPIAHPSFSVNSRQLATQVGGAAVLGIALSPVAAVLAFVDPGLAKDADCSALREEVPAE